jgi:8-oxo-(d)GTP phosphatase
MSELDQQMSDRVRVLLLRHAHALSRAKWTGDDTERPLSPRGQRQAELLADRFDRQPAIWVVSSPALRCVKTVAPLVQRAGRTIEIDERLMEGSDSLDAFELVDELVAKHADVRDVIVCSHGDVLLGMAELLVPRSIGLGAVRSVRKGGAIRVEYMHGVPIDARFIDPPQVS